MNRGTYLRVSLGLACSPARGLMAVMSTGNIVTFRGTPVVGAANRSFDMGAIVMVSTVTTLIVNNITIVFIISGGGNLLAGWGTFGS